MTDQTLEGSEEKTVRFTHTISEDRAENITVEISTEDENRSRSVEVLEVGKLLIDSITAPETAQQNELVEVQATLNNTGETRLNQTVEFTSDIGRPSDEIRNVTVEGGSTQQITFDYRTPKDQTGEATLTISSENDSASETITVEEDDGGGIIADFRIVEPPENGKITQGETLTVVVESEIIYGGSVVEVTFGGQNKSQEISRRMEFQFETDNLSPGQYTIDATRLTFVFIGFAETGSDQTTINIVPSSPGN